MKREEPDLAELLQALNSFASACADALTNFRVEINELNVRITTLENKQSGFTSTKH